MPSRSATPGRQFSNATSQWRAIFRALAISSGFFRSRITDFLPRLIVTQQRLTPFLKGGLSRIRSPRPGLSTLITSAPMSASSAAAYGPWAPSLKSSTLIPLRGPPIVVASGITVPQNHLDGEKSRRRELEKRHLLSCRFEYYRDRHSDLYGIVRHIDNIGNDYRSFFELDHRYVIGNVLLESGMPAVMIHDERPYGSTAAHRTPFEVGRQAFGTIRAGGIPYVAAIFAALKI